MAEALGKLGGLIGSSVCPIGYWPLVGLLSVFMLVCIYLFISAVTVLVVAGSLVGADYPKTRVSGNWIGSLGIIFSLAGAGTAGYGFSLLKNKIPS